MGQRKTSKKERRQRREATAKPSDTVDQTSLSAPAESVPHYGEESSSKPQIGKTVKARKLDSECCQSTTQSTPQKPPQKDPHQKRNGALDSGQDAGRDSITGQSFTDDQRQICLELDTGSRLRKLFEMLEEIRSQGPELSSTEIDLTRQKLTSFLTSISPPSLLSFDDSPESLSPEPTVGWPRIPQTDTAKY